MLIGTELQSLIESCEVCLATATQMHSTSSFQSHSNLQETQGRHRSRHSSILDRSGALLRVRRLCARRATMTSAQLDLRIRVAWGCRCAQLPTRAIRSILAHATALKWLSQDSLFEIQPAHLSLWRCNPVRYSYSCLMAEYN